jgi:hypothetical protein
VDTVTIHAVVGLLLILVCIVALNVLHVLATE